jgi:probable DNA repair protein
MNPNRLSPLIDISLFRNAIEKNYLILTANQRLANQIHQAWGESLLGVNRVWNTPRIMTLEQWQSHCWDELQDQNHQLVQGLTKLGDVQSVYLWEQAIAQYEDQSNSAYASMADSCLDLLQRWDLSAKDIQSSANSVNKFSAWAHSYQRLLRESRQITNATAWKLVREAFQSALLPKETVIALYGFQSIPPLQQTTLESASDIILDIVVGDHRAECVKVPCADGTKEMESAAKWAAIELKKNPSQRIGILVPELNSTVQPTARIVSEALAQYHCPIDVNISAGVTLNETPLIYSALSLLNLSNYKQSLEEWLRLLHSPYSLFAKLPVQFKVDCELLLRDSQSHQISIDSFVQIVRGIQATAEDPDALQPILEPLYGLRAALKQQSEGNKTFSQWALFFHRFTDSLQWPGARQLDSLERQQLQQWRRLLENYCALDSLGISLKLPNAISYLQKMASRHIFHPKTGDAPLQILGLLEGSGLIFDQLWIMGLGSDNFPSAQAMDPILPAQFQRAHAMPHSLPERELEIANKLLAGYQSNATKLILSWPLKEGESDIEASPLIKDIPLAAIDQLVPDHSDLPHWLQQDNHSQLIADKAPPLNRQFEPVSGGSSILKNQSTCPFNAFAIHRLAADKIKEPVLGLNAMVRGNILHEVLYRLWGDWKSAERLNDLSHKDLTEQVNRQINAVLTDQGKDHPVLQGLQFKALEQHRLSKLVMQWLELEKNRPPFEVVAVEQKNSIRLGELDISLTLDRVDSVDNKTVLIDYKTGSVNAKDWQGERPKDPQLPLYALAYSGAVNGCAFAQIKSNKLKFSGLMDEPFSADLALCDDWPQQMQDWRGALENLAAEFTEGNSALRVYNKSAFTYQDYLIPLNRWNEQNEITDADD